MRHGVRTIRLALEAAEAEDRSGEAVLVATRQRASRRSRAGGGASFAFTVSRDQREAVRQFLMLRLSDHHSAFHHPRIETALANDWTAKSEP